MVSKRSIATLRLCIGVSATGRHVCDFWSVLLALKLLLPETVELFPLGKLAEDSPCWGRISRIATPRKDVIILPKATETIKSAMVGKGRGSGCRGQEIVPLAANSLVEALIFNSDTEDSRIRCVTCGVVLALRASLSAPGVAVE